jgi:hypothetical protein
MKRLIHFSILAFWAAANVGCQSALKSSAEMDRAPLLNNGDGTEQIREEYIRFWGHEPESPPAPIRVDGGIGP